MNKEGKRTHLNPCYMHAYPAVSDATTFSVTREFVHYVSSSTCLGTASIQSILGDESVQLAVREYNPTDPEYFGLPPEWRLHTIYRIPESSNG